MSFFDSSASRTYCTYVTSSEQELDKTLIIKKPSSPVAISVVTNIFVILAIFGRKNRLKPCHVSIVALAVSDICFSLAIHPMLMATSFGVPATSIFSESGESVGSPQVEKNS